MSQCGSLFRVAFYREVLMRTNGFRWIGMCLFAAACFGAGGAASPHPTKCTHPADFVPDGVACSCGYRPTAGQNFYEHVYHACKNEPRGERKKHVLVDRVKCRHCSLPFQRPHTHEFYVLEQCPSDCAGDVKAQVCHCGEKRCGDPRQAPQAMCRPSVTVARR